jgi:hypothetical protein
MAAGRLISWLREIWSLVRRVRDLVRQRVDAAIAAETPAFRAAVGDLPVLHRIGPKLAAEPDAVVGAAPGIGRAGVGRAFRRGGGRDRSWSGGRADHSGGGEQFQGRAAGDGFIQGGNRI